MNFLFWGHIFDVKLKNSAISSRSWRLSPLLLLLKVLYFCILYLSIINFELIFMLCCLGLSKCSSTTCLKSYLSSLRQHKPSGEWVVCLSSGHSRCLNNLLVHRLLCDPGTEPVCLDVPLLVGQGLVKARPGWLSFIGWEKTRCSPPGPFVQSWGQSLLAFLLHLSEFSLVVSCTLSRACSDA